MNAITGLRDAPGSFGASRFHRATCFCLFLFPFSPFPCPHRAPPTTPFLDWRAASASRLRQNRDTVLWKLFHRPTVRSVINARNLTEREILSPELRKLTQPRRRIIDPQRNDTERTNPEIFGTENERRSTRPYFCSVLTRSIDHTVVAMAGDSKKRLYADSW